MTNFSVVALPNLFLSLVRTNPNVENNRYTEAELAGSELICTIGLQNAEVIRFVLLS